MKSSLCASNHKITLCDQIKTKSPSEMKKFVEQEKLRWNCLAKIHILQNCESVKFDVI